MNEDSDFRLREDELLMARREMERVQQEMDRVQQDRLSHLETRIDDLANKVKHEVVEVEKRISARISLSEQLMAEQSAALAVKRTFQHLGVDVDSATDLQRFRDDLRFGGVFRTAATKSFLALLAAICGGIGLSIWLVFKEKAGLP